MMWIVWIRLYVWKYYIIYIRIIIHIWYIYSDLVWNDFILFNDFVIGVNATIHKNLFTLIYIIISHTITGIL